MRFLTSTATAAALLVVLTGCSTSAGDVSHPATPGRPGFQTTAPLPSAGTPIELSAAQQAGIRADLAKRGITSAFTVESATAKTWPDGSWGCPQPGMVYTQALVAGARVVVSVKGTSYDYRFGTGPTPRLCEKA